MKIRRLVLDNFKSFAGRAEIAFPAGVAVVIGPNGSGKSNMVDALRWVFGEDDSAVLRTRSSADLMFRGRKSHGVAGCRVTALLDGVGPGSDDEASLVISRSIGADGCENYAVGEESLDRSQYLAALRQRGVAAPLTTVIGQGEVGRLLWLHPAERTRLLAQDVLAAVRPIDPERGDLLAMRLDEERAGLLLACAPRGDDPLLEATLSALGLPFPREGSVSLEEALVAAESRIRSLEGIRADRSAPHEYVLDGGLSTAREGRHRAFLELHNRVEKRFDAFFRALTPGGGVALPLVAPEPGEELPGVDIAVRFPRRPAVPLDGLSGGQLSVAGLCLALAVFLEVPSPALVLDEVEPALDEALLRRLTRLFAQVARERQIIAVSHQRLMRNTADYVLQIKRDASGSRVDFQYDPRMLRAPGAPVR